MNSSQFIKFQWQKLQADHSRVLRYVHKHYTKVLASSADAKDRRWFQDAVEELKGDIQEAAFHGPRVIYGGNDSDSDMHTLFEDKISQSVHNRLNLSP